jgi:hypothetical protein
VPDDLNPRADFARRMLLWPSMEQEAQWRAEARANPPDLASWQECYVGWRWAQELDRQQADLDRRLERASEEEERELQRQQITPPECPSGLWAINYATGAIFNFLMNQRNLPFFARGHPWTRLMLAINHLATGGGHVPAFLKPVRGPGSPGKGDGVDIVKALAARTYAKLVEGGQKDAAHLVACALREASRRGLGPVNAATVQNWHERVEQGPGPGASRLMVEQYRQPIDPPLGDTPLQEGEALLAVLEIRAMSFVG